MHVATSCAAKEHVRPKRARPRRSQIAMPNRSASYLSPRIFQRSHRCSLYTLANTLVGSRSWSIRSLRRGMRERFSPRNRAINAADLIYVTASVPSRRCSRARFHEGDEKCRRREKRRYFRTRCREKCLIARTFAFFRFFRRGAKGGSWEIITRTVFNGDCRAVIKSFVCDSGPRVCLMVSLGDDSRLRLVDFIRRRKLNFCRRSFLFALGESFVFYRNGISPAVNYGECTVR